MRPVARLIIRIVGRRAETVSCGVDPCRQRRLIRDGHGLGNPQVVGGVLVVCVLVSCVAGLLAGVERLEHLAAGARAEFEAGEQFRKRVGVHLAECQILDADTEVDVAPQRVDLAVELDLLDVLAQRLALLAAYLVGVLDDTLKSAVLVDPLRREPVADAGHAGDVVGSLATQRRKIRVLRGADMVLVLHRLRRHVLEVLEVMPGIQHGDALVDQLEGVAVAGQHQRVVSGPLPHRGERGDDVVALIPLLFDVGDAQRREHLLDERQLGEQVLRRRFAGALVLRQHLVAEGAALHVERDREMVGLLAVQHLGQHRGETPYRVRGLSGLSTEIFRR